MPRLALLMEIVALDPSDRGNAHWVKLSQAEVIKVRFIPGGIRSLLFESLSKPAKTETFIQDF